MIKHWWKYLLMGICIILFLIPFFPNSGYSVGGDDARLYYLYPKEYLTQYLFQVMSANGLGGNMGYMAVSYSVPIIGLICIVKTLLPIINVQHVFYGLNLSLGFLFCFLFFRMHDTTGESIHIVFAILASCLYITSPYIAKTIFQPELIMIYLVMLVPLFFYTFTRGLKDKNMKFIVGSALVIAVFSSSLYSFPWFVPLLFVCIPYFIYCAFQYRFFFWKSVLVFIFVSIGLHWYWIIHGLLSIVSSRVDTTLASLIVSKEFIQDAENTIYSSMFLNNPIHQIAGYLRTSWSDHLPMSSWNLIGCISLIVVSLAGMMLKGVTKQLRVLFGVSLASLCISLFMITPNIGKWNMDVFLFLNRTIPLFSMFRNMSGKFGLAIAFVFAFTIFLSFIIIGQAKNKLWRWIPLGFGIILFIYQLPLFFNFQGLGVAKPYVTELSSDYLQLVQYVSALDTTKRFVWYPMTFPGYTPIQDKINKNSWYLGISPLQILAGKSDLTGFYGIQTPINPYRNWKIFDLFKQKKYEEIISLLASYNVGYVITLKDKLPETVYNHLNLFSFIATQTEEYKELLLGKKIYDDGNMYSVYTINPDYSFDTVFLTNNAKDIHAPKNAVPYRHIKTNMYEVTLPPETEFQSLVLLTPYHVLWNITFLDKEENGVSLTNHRVAYDYGNVWDIQRTGNLTRPVKLIIEFIPDRFTMPSVIASCMVFMGGFLYICYPKKRE